MRKYYVILNLELRVVSWKDYDSKSSQLNKLYTMMNEWS